MYSHILIIALFIYLPSSSVMSFSDVGRWDITLNGEKCDFSLTKSMFKGSQVFVIINCDTDTAVNLTVFASLNATKCSEYYHYFQKTDGQCYDQGDNSFDFKDKSFRSDGYYEDLKVCDHKQPIVIEGRISEKDEAESLKKNEKIPTQMARRRPLFTTKRDSTYVFMFGVKLHKALNLTVHIEMQSAHGYLSAAIWPLLPFFGAMCGVYTILCTGWLVVCMMQWRDLLRIQFWIGGVAILGMVESATYYAVYSSINSSGVFNPKAYIFAEWVSVAKRSLARMLVIIVSLGFGIVKPRLGPALQRVLGAGLLYGLLGAIEAWLKLHHKQRNFHRDLMLSEAPLAILDSAICWWIFVSLANTTRTLRLRRNTVKLALYRHFTNTLIFAVVSSVVFMLYSTQMYKFKQCIQNWREVWLDDGYWHILFASLLTVIMVLWRPTINNQRYAFTPLLDNADDEDDEEEQFVNDSYGVKMRGSSMSGGGDTAEGCGSVARDDDIQTADSLIDEDLRWVEENIPATALPVLDSDEEIINTKFEVSKMQ